MKEREWDNWHLDLGGRLEKVTVDPQLAAKEDYNLFGASAALQYFLAEHQHLSLGLTHAERAPVAEELFADGAHIAEARYLIGNSELDKENSLNLELGYHHHNEGASGWHAAKVEASIFYNQVGDYIYARNTGLEDHESEFDIYAYANRDATFYGAEASVKFPLREWLSLTLFGDSVRAQFDDRIAGESRDVPRLPPLRAGLALGGDFNQWTWDWRTSRSSAQRRAGAFEEATDGYTRMDLTLQYNLKLGETDAVIFASGRNLLDEEIRNSTSLLRDFAPEMGRSVEAGVRFIF
jgi:iron complex outermembrane receptor protein